jgi:hypothetical protein
MAMNEQMLRMVHSSLMAWLTKCREETVTADQKLESLMFNLAMLALALAGGYEEEGDLK